MSKITDAEANATSLDGLVNDNALVPTLRNGPKPSYQYLVDGWNTEFDALIDNLEVQGDNAIALINADVVTVDAAKDTAISSIDSDLSAFDTYYQSAKDSLDDDVAAFTIDSDAALAEFAQESAEAFNEFDLTLDQYKESRGFNTKGTFADGFTYELPNDVGLDSDGNPWILIDTSSLPVIVSAGTTPSNPPYKQVAYGTAAQVSTNTSDTVQSFIDSFALKIFQSPTDGGLTEIQTRTVNAGEVYEVRKTSDDSLATIYSDAAGTTEIMQNGTDNKSGSDGVVEFYIGDGDYYVEVGSITSGFSTVISAAKITTEQGRTAQEQISSLIKTQKQPSIVSKMRDLSKPSFNYIRVSSGVVYVGSVFGGSPYMPVDPGTYLTGTEWKFSTNSDNLLLMTGGFSGDVAQEYTTQPEISLDGTFVLSAPNAYTVTVGDKFTGTTTGGRIVLFKHYADNRGGVWKFTTNNGIESKISTYSTGSTITTDVIFDNLDPSEIYTITAEYLGDDPLHAPTGGVSRGWLFYEGGNASVQPFETLEFLGLENEVPLSATGSINDFAISARYSGSGSAYNWVPQHNRSGVSTDVITKIYVDGAVLSNSSIAPDSGIKEIESFSIQARFKARNSNTPSTVLWTHYVTHSVADGVLSINNRMEFISETEISVAYLALVGADISKVNRIVYSSGLELETSADNTNNFFSNSTNGVMYSGAFDEVRGIYHGLGCDVDVYSSCAIGTQLEDDKVNYQTFRDDNVNKTYWLCASGKIVPPGTVIKSSASHYMVNGIRSPNLDISSI